MARPGAAMVDIEALRATVTNLTEAVSRLTIDVAGLMASHDGGVYGDDYAADRGPAVRARFFEEANDYNVRRMAELTEQVTQLEATMAEMASIQTTYNEGVDRMMDSVTRLEGEQKDHEVQMNNLREEWGASIPRAPPDRKDRTVIITNLKGSTA